MRAEFRTTTQRLGAWTIQKIRPRPAVALTGLAATAVLSASLAGAPFAQASTASAHPGVTGQDVNVSEPHAAYETHVRAYWTPAKMRAARNADALAVMAGPVKSGPVKNTQAHAQEPRNTGQPGRVAGVAPTQRLSGGIKPGPGDHRATPADGSSAGQWPGNPYLPPATTTGKVFFTTNGDENWVCSGSTVNSDGKDAVITAGHCVYGDLNGDAPGTTWHTDNWAFVPDYNNGSAPYGIWTPSQLWTLTNYMNTGGSMADEPDDIGAAVMNTNSYGQHIVDVVGGQGIEWNYPYYQYVDDFGYPAESPFNGQVLDYCSGGEFGWFAGTMGLNCDLNGGSSGGPWLASFDGEWGYINGVNDFDYPSLPNYIFAAYFGSNAGSLYNAVAGA